MKSFTIILLFALLAFNGIQAQKINISYDYTSAEKLIDILDSNELREKDFDDLIRLHGTKSYLKKLSTFFPDINESTFKQSLEAAAKGTRLENDPFMFDRILPHIPSIKKLLAEIRNNDKNLAETSTSLLSQYSPETISMDVTVYLVLGIVGGGWTFDDNPDAFYVDLTSIKDDYLGLVFLSTHELYHLAQYRFMSEPIQKESNNVLFLLDQMVREGSASYVADFSKISDSGSYLEFSKKEYILNFRRMKTNFALFETLLLQANNSAFIDIDLLYNIGLSGMYQSPLYYVGYHMMKLIDRYSGHQVLIDLLNQSPEKIVLTYIELYHQYSNEDDEFIAISDMTINLLESINNTTFIKR